MNSNVRNWVALVGRIALALIFITSGWGKINNFAGTAGYMANAGVPMAQLLLALTIVIELGGGLMLAVGWKARWAALAFALWLVPVTLVFHAFWSATPDQVQMQTINFMKNVSILGGMLMVFAFGPGAFAIERDKS